MAKPSKPHSQRVLEPIDPTTIAPLNSNGKPDLYNYMPTRLVPQDESKLRGWSLFYMAVPCRYGHIAPRYTSNPRMCVDCNRLANGKAPLGVKAGGTPEYKARPYKQREPTAPAQAGPITIKPVEPDAREKAFLEKYAATKEISSAAAQSGLSVSQVESRIAYSAVFKDAVNALEERLGIKKTVDIQEHYEWTDEKRERLIEIYVDTGDLASARDSIRVTPSEYFRELNRNEDFAERVQYSQAFASRALEERAIQLALAGNDKLLTKILSAKMPEYRERVSMDMNVTEKLDDRQLDSKLARLLTKLQSRVIDGTFEDAEEVGEVRAIGGPRGEREED